MNDALNIQCIDALIGLKELSDESIDCIITDPPYEVISGGHGGKDSSSQAKRPTGILSKNDGKIFAYNNLKINNWIKECYRVLKNDGFILIGGGYGISTPDEIIKEINEFYKSNINKNDKPKLKLDEIMDIMSKIGGKIELINKPKHGFWIAWNK